LYDDAEGRVVCPLRAIVAPIHKNKMILLSLLSSSSGALVFLSSG
jgi:hypothetical protein